MGQWWLSGHFKGNGGRKVESNGDHHANTDGNLHEFELGGTLDAVSGDHPHTPDPDGPYRVKDSGNTFSSYTDDRCDVRRAFTAVRVVKEFADILARGREEDSGPERRG
ncbi:hypothetical protein [Corallococcus exiguus]|uniref:hypothetical protein n=1 Tax=Corallococcus exiguus TaxID=83462 RepID=UPI001A8E9428|nr:hypothetical protein [Corallococcus exiguus]